MEIITTPLKDLLVIRPKVFGDERGWFYESFQKRNYEKLALKLEFVQDNRSYSTKGTLRGLHFQRPPYTQAKLVSCNSGKVFDLVVDLRTSSPTYQKAFGIILDDENKLQLFVPKGFAHGFYVMSESAEFFYKCDDYYHPEAEGGVHYLSEQVKNLWPEQVLDKNSIKISQKDLNLPHLSEHSCVF